MSEQRDVTALESQGRSSSTPLINYSPRIQWLLDLVGSELDKAMGSFPPFNSPHEGKAVIEEELDELWELRL